MRLHRPHFKPRLPGVTFVHATLQFARHVSLLDGRLRWRWSPGSGSGGLHAQQATLWPPPDHTVRVQIYALSVESGPEYYALLGATAGADHWARPACTREVVRRAG